MSEPTGTPVPASQAPPSNSPTPGQPATPPAPSAQPAAPPATEPTPAAPAQDTSAQLAEVQARLAQAEQSSRYHQSEKDRIARQLQAVVGAQPPVDPLAEKIKGLVDQGYDPKDARAIGELVQSMVSPIATENARLKSSLSATHQINHAIQQATQQEPGLFADHRIFTATQTALQHAALQGPDLVNPAYALSIAMGEWAQLNRPWAQPTPTAPPGNGNQPPRPPSYGFLGPQPGYTPAPPAATQPVMTPAHQQVQQELNERFNIKPTP